MLQVTVQKRLSDFTLDVTIACRRRITGIFGPSGCGKTTLLNCLAGVIQPDTGRIQLDDTLWFDLDGRADMPSRLRRVGYVFQDSLLFDHMTIEHNITYGQRSGSSGPGYDDVVHVLEIKPLLQRIPAELSGGQRRRVAIARALLRHPALLLFDEPLSGLDANLAGRVIVFLKRVLDAFAIPAIYVSHSISDIAYLCDEAVVLRDGMVVAQASPMTVINQRGVLSEHNLPALQNMFNAEILEMDLEDQSIRCRLGDETLTVYGSPVDRDGPLTLAISACDIVLATHKPQGISARNALQGTVVSVEPVGSKVLVMVDVGVRWMVEVGRAAVSELNLRGGSRVFAIIKATAINIL